MAIHIETPLVESRPLSLIAGRSVYLKLDALQPPGSFKIRGIGLACETYLARGAQRFISSSGGNAGLAVAYAGCRLGVPVIVVVPETTSNLVEPACGVSLAMVYDHAQMLDSYKNILVIVCGGATATIVQIRDWAGKTGI